MKYLVLLLVIGCSSNSSGTSIGDSCDGGNNSAGSSTSSAGSSNGGAGGYLNQAGSSGTTQCIKGTTRCKTQTTTELYKQSTQICLPNGAWADLDLCSGETDTCIDGKCVDTCGGTCTLDNACSPPMYTTLHGTMYWTNQCTNKTCICTCPDAVCNVGNVIACGKDCQ